MIANKIHKLTEELSMCLGSQPAAQNLIAVLVEMTQQPRAGVDEGELLKKFETALAPIKKESAKALALTEEFLKKSDNSKEDNPLSEKAEKILKAVEVLEGIKKEIDTFKKSLKTVKDEITKIKKAMPKSK